MNVNESKMNITNGEIVEFLEQRIHSDSASQSEEALYIDYQDHGNRVFRWEENKSIVNKIVKAIKREYGLI